MRLNATSRETHVRFQSDARDPTQRFARQLIERGDGELKMLLFRVLDFVVADAV